MCEIKVNLGDLLPLLPLRMSEEDTMRWALDTLRVRKRRGVPWAEVCDGKNYLGVAVLPRPWGQQAVLREEENYPDVEGEIGAAEEEARTSQAAKLIVDPLGLCRLLESVSCYVGEDGGVTIMLLKDKILITRGDTLVALLMGKTEE